MGKASDPTVDSGDNVRTACDWLGIGIPHSHLPAVLPTVPVARTMCVQLQVRKIRSPRAQ